MEWAVVSHWFGSLAFFHGERLLRVKGLLVLAGEAKPVAVHGVHGLLHEPAVLPAWPDNDRSSRIVFITCDLAREPIEAALRRARHDVEINPQLSLTEMPDTGT